MRPTGASVLSGDGDPSPENKEEENKEENKPGLGI